MRRLALSLPKGLAAALALLLPACSAPADQPVSASSALPSAISAPSPNFVVILADDLGYDDVGCYWTPDPRPGFEKINTPNLDRLASEGVRFTDFYAAAHVCTPTRAALLTGSHPVRIGMSSFEPGGAGLVLGPADDSGLNPGEITIPELLKGRGYATACIGKWHLGHREPFQPRRHGFDVFFGGLFANDYGPDFKILRGGTVVEEAPVDQTTLTRRFTEESIRFLRENRDRPFFLYLAHTAPHIPLHADPRFAGKSARGVYGDLVEEVDGSAGEVLKTIAELGLDRKTLVFFTSDNGPDTRGPYAKRGQALPLRGTKATTREGGMRVPAIARWPGRIPAGTVTREVASVMDLLPTLAGLAGAEAPKDRILDGRDILPLLTTPGAKSPHEAFFYYSREKLEAVRSGRWKLAFARSNLDDIPYERKKKGVPPEEILPEALYDLEADIAESVNVIDKHPDVAARLRALAEKAREDLGDSAAGRKGRNVRPRGRL